MDAVLEKPRHRNVPEGGFTRKLTPEEIDELLENFYYDPRYLNPDYDDGEELEPIWDKYGNPTESTLRAMYEDRHDIGSEPMTLEELFADFDRMIAEAD